MSCKNGANKVQHENKAPGFGHSFLCLCSKTEDVLLVWTLSEYNQEKKMWNKY